MAASPVFFRNGLRGWCENPFSVVIKMSFAQFENSKFWVFSQCIICWKVLGCQWNVFFVQLWNKMFQVRL